MSAQGRRKFKVTLRVVRTGDTGHDGFVEMDQKQSAARSHSQRCASGNADRVYSATLQPQRRNDLAHIVSWRRAHENAENDHLTAYHI